MCDNRQSHKIKSIYAIVKEQVFEIKGMNSKFNAPLNQSSVNTSSLECCVIPHDNIERGKMIAEGAYGEIYKGFWNGKQIAIKTQKHPVFCLAEKERLSKEARILSSLRHPNIVSCFGICHLKSDLWIIMERINGGDLYDLMHSKKQHQLLHKDAKVSLSLQMSDAIRYLHDEKGIVHNDIKPQNILIQFQNGDPKAYIADFGFACCPAGSDSLRNMRLGSSLYRAPELMEIPWNKHTFSSASDIWSLGLVLAELFILDFVKEYKEKYLYRKPGQRPHYLKELPDFAQEIISRCLDLDNFNRPSAKELTMFFKFCLTDIEK